MTIRQIVHQDGTMKLGVQESIDAAERAEDAADRATDAVNTAVATAVSQTSSDAARAEAAAEAAASQIIADQRVPTDADRIALTDLASGATVYVIDTGHTWQWSGSAWDDLGQGPLADKAGNGDVAHAVSSLKSRVLSMIDVMRVEGMALALFDRAGNPLVLQLRGTDGNISDWTADNWLTRFRERDRQLPHTVSMPGIAWALFDAAGNAIPLMFRDSDGAPTDWTVDTWGARLAERGWGGGTVGTIHVPPDMRIISAWGSSSIEHIRTQLKAVVEDLGAEYIDGGQGSEWSHHTTMRQGGVPMYVTFPGNMIPASGAADITIENFSPTTIFKPSHVVVEGVEGVLTSTATQAIFTRLSAGDPVPVTAGSLLIPVDGLRARAGVQILNIGKNDLVGTLSIPNMLARFQACYDYVSSTPRRVIVMGHYVNRDVAEVSVTRDRIISVNEQWAAEFGSYYLDQQDYLMSSQVWTDTGLTPTQTDLDHQAIGSLPPSLTSDGTHLNTVANVAMAARIRARLISLGWYEE